MKNISKEDLEVIMRNTEVKTYIYPIGGGKPEGMEKLEVHTRDITKINLHKSYSRYLFWDERTLSIEGNVFQFPREKISKAYYIGELLKGESCHKFLEENFDSWSNEYIKKYSAVIDFFNGSLKTMEQKDIEDGDFIVISPKDVKFCIDYRDIGKPI